MQDQWKMDAESEDHRSRRDMTEKSIARYVKSEAERQVTSSSSSASGNVYVSDAAWLCGASLAQATYLCCGLSNGSVCLLNTTNLSKIYLFELDRDPRSSSRSGDRHGHRPGHDTAAPAPPQLVAVATHIIPATASTTAASAGPVQALLCVTLDEYVCVCPLDMATVLERKKLSRSDMARVMRYPPVAPGAVLHASLQFNSKGNAVAALLCVDKGAAAASATASSSLRWCVAVIASPDASVTLQSAYKGGSDWHTLVPPAPGSGADDDATVELCYCGWWSADTLVCVWSNSCLQFVHAAESLRVVAECRLLRQCGVDVVTNATVSRPSGSAEAADGAVSGLVAIVLENNVVASFFVATRPGAATEVPGLKRDRAEAQLAVLVTPTMQTFCTEDIPVREIHLARSFSWTVVLLLESGALVFLDAETMRLSVHRAVNRLRAPDATRYRAGPLLAAPRHYFCEVSGRPFAAVVLELNTAILMKAQ